MFTGLVAGLGQIIACTRFANERRFQIRPQFEMRDIVDGESISINGVCLSVEKHAEQVFEVYASGETLSRTTLGSFGQGDLVNLERALELGQRLGGHIVSGHIDCVASIEKIVRSGQSRQIRAAFPIQFSGQVITKGSICLDGISLTVNACGRGFLEVNIIPDSLKRTNISQWRPGDRVNMETDIIGKYVQHMLKPWDKPASMDREFLAANGFI